MGTVAMAIPMGSQVLSEHRTQVGWTLIEVLIVCSVLGILAGIGFPLLSDSVNTSREKKAVAMLRQIAMRIDMYAVDMDQYPWD